MLKRVGLLKKKAQMSSFTQKRAHKSGPLKKVLKRGDTQKVLKKVIKRVGLLRVRRTFLM